MRLFLILRDVYELVELAGGLGEFRVDLGLPLEHDKSNSSVDSVLEHDQSNSSAESELCF